MIAGNPMTGQAKSPRSTANSVPVSAALRLAGAALLIEGLLATIACSLIVFLFMVLASGNIFQRIAIGILNQANITLLALILVGISFLILYGGIRMRRARQYGFALIGAALGFLAPVTMAYLFRPAGMAMLVEIAMGMTGLWALRTLLTKRVRLEFATMKARRR